MNRSGFEQPRFTILRSGLARRGIKPRGRGHSTADFRHCLVRAKERLRLVREVPKHDRAVHVVEGGSLRAPNEPVGFRRRGPVRESGAQKNAAGRLLRRGGLRAAERVVRKRDRGALEGFVLLRGFSLFPKHRGFESRAAGRVREGFGRKEQRLFDGFRGVRGVRIRNEGESPRLVEKGPLEASARLFP